MAPSSTYNRTNRRPSFGDWFWLARGAAAELDCHAERPGVAILLRAAAVACTLAAIGVVVLGCSRPAGDASGAALTVAESPASEPVGGEESAAAPAVTSESESPSGTSAGGLAAADDLDDAAEPANKHPTAVQSLSDRLLKASRDRQFAESAEAPASEPARRELASAAYSPPYPEREEMFIAPQVEVAVQAPRSVGTSRIALKGIALLGAPQALVEIDGRVFHLRVSQEHQGVSVVSIDPPQVTLKHGDHQWTESLSDARHASAKARPRKTAN